jgi:hypothetical protein
MRRGRGTSYRGSGECTRLLRRHLEEGEGETINDLTEPNAEVGATHPKAMPVILTTPEDVEIWMTRPRARPRSCSAAFGRLAADRRPRDEGRPGRVSDVSDEDTDDQAAPCGAMGRSSSARTPYGPPNAMPTRSTFESNRHALEKL